MAKKESGIDISDPRWRGLIFFIASLIPLVFGFREYIFVQLPQLFRSPLEDMSFGWYVPVFSIYVIWCERKRIFESVGAPSPAGIAAMLPFLFIGFLGCRGAQIRFAVLSFAGLLVTVAWAMCGRRTAVRMLFPAAFLLFCIPLSSFLDVVTVHLRLLAITISQFVLQGCGAEIVRSGTAIHALDGSFAIDVAQPCSGIRSIFALAALTVGYSYFNQPTWFRRALLSILAIPLAIAGNVARILTICLVANYASPDFATGFYHDYSGYVVFLVAILLMLACGEAIDRLFDRK